MFQLSLRFDEKIRWKTWQSAKQFLSFRKSNEFFASKKFERIFPRNYNGQLYNCFMTFWRENYLDLFTYVAGGMIPLSPKRSRSDLGKANPLLKMGSEINALDFLWTISALKYLPLTILVEIHLRKQWYSSEMKMSLWMKKDLPERTWWTWSPSLMYFEEWQDFGVHFEALGNWFLELSIFFKEYVMDEGDSSGK